MKIRTPIQATYGKSWLGVKGLDFIIFSVKACHTAGLVLTASPRVYTQSTYEVVLSQQDGSSVIRNQVF